MVSSLRRPQVEEGEYQGGFWAPGLESIHFKVGVPYEEHDMGDTKNK